MARFTVGTSGTRTNNKFGAYAFPANPGYVFITRLSLYVEGIATTVQRWSWQRMTGATVTPETPEKASSRSPTFAGTAARLESVNGTLVGNPYYIASAGQEALTPTRHRGFPRPQAVPQLIDGEQASMSANVNTGAGVAYDNYLGFEDAPLNVGERRLSRRPRENGWYHRYEHVCERVAGTQIVGSLRSPLVWRTLSWVPGGRRSRAILGAGVTNATITLTTNAATASAILVRTVGKKRLASANAAATEQNQPTRVFTPTANAAAVLVRAPLHVLTALATASALLSRIPGRIFTPSVATATATLLRTPIRLLVTSVATASATLVRMPVKVLAATATASATLTRRPLKAYTATANAAATILRTPGRPFTTSIATASAALTRLPVKALTATATASAALQRLPSHVFTLSANAAATLIRRPQKILTTSVATASAALTMIKVKTISLTTNVVTASAVLTRQPNRVMAPSATASALLTRLPRHTLTATATAAATLAKTPGKGLTTSVVSAAATLLRRAGRPFTATASATAALTRTVRKTLTTATGAVATFLGTPIHAALQWPPILRLTRGLGLTGEHRGAGRSGRSGGAHGDDGGTGGDGSTGRTGGLG